MKHNKEALVMGLLNFGTFPSVAIATRAALEFAVDANDSGHALLSLAVLMNKADPTSVSVTLARRHFWRSAGFELPADVLARLAAQDEKDSLLVLVVHEHFASHTVLTLAEMKEALT